MFNNKYVRPNIKIIEDIKQILLLSAWTPNAVYLIMLRNNKTKSVSLKIFNNIDRNKIIISLVNVK